MTASNHMIHVNKFTNIGTKPRLSIGKIRRKQNEEYQLHMKLNSKKRSSSSIWMQLALEPSNDKMPGLKCIWLSDFSFGLQLFAA